MNTKLKNSNGWILCPSKTFPGKFYYFNVLNGETAWSCDPDKRNLKNLNNDIQKVTDDCHIYPEPVDPPSDFYRPTSNVFEFIPNLKSSNFYQTQSSLYFGNKDLPRYMPKTTCQNASENIHLQQVFSDIEEKPQNLFQVTQNTSHQFRYNNSLSRFTNLKPNPFAFRSNISNLNTKFTNNRLLESKLKSINVKRSFTNMGTSAFLREPVLKEPKTTATLTSPNFSPEASITQNTSTSKSTAKADITLLLKDKITSVPKLKINTDINLEKSDLRYKLQDRKRKSIDLDEPVVAAQPVLKKKVTFKLNSSHDANPFENVYEGVPEQGLFVECTKPSQLDAQDLAELASSNARKDIWYIIPDTDILIHYYGFLIKLLEKAPSSRIHIPRAVFEYLSVASRDPAHPHVSTVRAVLRRLNHKDVQEPESEMVVQNLSILERLLNLCMFLMTHKYHVIIITNDISTYKRAKSLHLHCFTLDEISLSPLTGDKELSFNLHRIKETIENGRPIENVSKNLVLKSPDKISFFPTNNEEVDINKIQKTKNLNYLFTNYKRNKENNNNLSYSYLMDLSDSSDMSSSLSIKKDFKNLKLNAWSSQKNKNNLSAKSLMFEPPSDELSSSDSQIMNKATQYSNCSNRPDSKTFVNSNLPVSANSQLSKFYNWPVTREEVGGFKPNTLNMEDTLRMFRLTNKVVEERVRSRIDEWICCLTQTMEDALSKVLKENVKARLPHPAPWYFQEAVDCIFRLPSNERIARVSRVLGSMLRRNEEARFGKVKTTIEPRDFLQILGYSHRLLEALKDWKPNLTTLQSSMNTLEHLLQLVQSESMDPDQTTLENKTVITAVSDEEQPNKCFVKSHSDVLKYVQKHFPMSLGADKHTNTKQDNLPGKESSTPSHRDMKKFEDISEENEDINSLPTKCIEVCNDPRESLRFIRKSNLIHEFENKLNIKHKLDLDALDYEVEVNCSNENERKTEGMSGVMSDLTADSESNIGALTFIFIKEFLLSMRASLRDIYNFINDNISYLNANKTFVDEVAVRRQADFMLKKLRFILVSLEGIRSREQADFTSLKHLLKDAVPMPVAIRRAKSYRMIIQQFIEQASLLEKCLLPLCGQNNDSK